MVWCIQLRTLPIGLENIALPSDEVRRKVFEASNTVTGRRARGKGTMEFEALMRQLDHAVSSQGSCCE